MVSGGGDRLSAGFAHLHVRSGFSFGYGTAMPGELIETAARMSAASLALTDRDGLHGIPRFLKAASVAGVSPIVGAEVSVGAGTHPVGHVVLLAENMAGYRSLCRLITAYRCSAGDRRRPVCSPSTLFEHVEGLVCLTGAIPFGLVPRLVLGGRREEACGFLRRAREAFGEDRVYVELSDDRTAGSRRRLARVEAFARERGVPTLATNEVAYLKPGDHRLHEVLVAASSLSTLPGPGYRPTDQLYLKPPRRMEKLFSERPEALKNAAEVAEMCSGAVRLKGPAHAPGVRLPDGETTEGRLDRIARRGAKKRYGSPGGEVQERLERELSCIKKLGFAPYFLLAYEAAGIARSRGIPITGRGSAANSLVAYCLGLTNPEPLKNRLLFERFMHEGRADPPDIDLDLCSRRRDEVRDEVIRRYHGVGVAVAATVSTLSLRGAVRVAARALGHPPKEINELSRHVPTRFTDRSLTYNPLSGWEEALREPAMRGHPLQDTKRHQLLLELSGQLKGRVWQAGTHLGGLVVGNEKDHLSELVPLEPSGKEGLLRAQYDKDDLEYAGLPKLDLLGLRMHTALHAAGELASRRLGRKVDPYDPPQGDEETYRLIGSGRNVGMFQLESPGQMNLSTRLKPQTFSHLVAQISLFRPGPVRGDLVTPYVRRRNGLEGYSLSLPELGDILKPTFGVMVFQEQVLEVCHKVAGFSLAEGDLIRRAMTRERGPAAMQALKERFVGRAVSRGVPTREAEEVFSWMEGFSVYGFSAAHGAAFAELAYASAYMRTHYPAEFFCALLNSQPMGFYSPRVLLNEVRRIGLTVLPPNVYLSGQSFTVEEEGTALRVGLRYCKGLAEREISSIIAARRERPFSSVADLYRRTRVKRDSLEMLIKGGFLDPLADRSRLLDEVGRLPKRRGDERQPEIPLPHPASWWTAREDVRLEYLPLAETTRERVEWEALSLNVPRHPLVPYRAALRELGVVPSEEIRGLPHGTRARAAGLIECLQRPPTKSGQPVYFLLIEDEQGLLQATIFRSVYSRYGDLLHHEGAFLLEGRVEQSENRGFSFLVSRVVSLRDAISKAGLPTPRMASSSGAFLRSKRRGRRAG